MRDRPERSSFLLAVLATGGSFVVWGIVPIYWKALDHVDSVELAVHRFVWSFVFCAGLVSWRGRWPLIREALASKRTFGVFALSGSLLAVSWFTFIWAANHDHLIECSLGYFISPLVNVLLGFVFLRERLRPWQVIAVVLACLGVGNRIVSVDQFPVVALTLGLTFGFYCLIRKTAALGPLSGLLSETMILSVPAGAYLIFLAARGEGALGHTDVTTHILVLSVGVLTALPLLFFTYGARRLRLSTVGFLQYFTPTGHFLLGVFLYGEPFTRPYFVTFGFVWAGLAIYSVQGVMSRKKLREGAREDDLVRSTVG